MKEVKNAMLQPSLNTDALVSKSLSFYTSCDDESITLFTKGIENVENFHNNISITHMMLNLMTGTLDFSWFDYADINIRDMSNEEAHNNAIEIYRMYAKKVVDINISGEGLAWIADITYDENTNEIMELKLVNNNLTHDTIKLFQNTFECKGDMSFDEF